MTDVRRALIDDAVSRYFEAVGLDMEATRATIAEARIRKLAEVRVLRVEAEKEAQRSRDRLTRVTRDYTDGKLDAEDWRAFRDELTAEQQAAEAEG